MPPGYDDDMAQMRSQALGGEPAESSQGLQELLRLIQMSGAPGPGRLEPQLSAPQPGPERYGSAEAMAGGNDILPAILMLLLDQGGFQPNKANRNVGIESATRWLDAMRGLQPQGDTDARYRQGII